MGWEFYCGEFSVRCIALLISILLLPVSANADVITLTIKFDPTAGSFDRYLSPTSSDNERYLFVGRTFSPISLSQGDTLSITFTGLPDFPISSSSNDAHLNASITFASTGPVFSGEFSILDYSGVLNPTDFHP